MAELLPCPFCGHEPFVRPEPTRFGWWRVECGDCGTLGPDARWQSDAMEGWNLRPPDPDTRAEGINAGLALVSEWLDAAGVPRGPKGHGVAETVQARLAGLAASPPSADGDPSKADQPARAALRAALRRLREGPPHAGAADPDAWVRELRRRAEACPEDPEVGE